jgi:flagellar basal body-associated protein FliL
MSQVAAPAAPGKAANKNTKIIIIVVIILLIIAAIVTYYFVVYKPAQLKGLPTSAPGLASGAKWNNNGKVEIVP